MAYEADLFFYDQVSTPVVAGETRRVIRQMSGLPDQVAEKEGYQA